MNLTNEKLQETSEVLKDSYELNKTYATELTGELDDILDKIKKLESKKEVLEIKIKNISGVLKGVKKVAVQLNLFDLETNPEYKDNVKVKK